jgi:capsular exopolysaccharide synthesis family protein
MTPIYRGTSRVQVEADTSTIQSLNDLYQKMTTDEAFLQTQIEVLKSESLAWRTIEQLRLADNPGFVGKITSDKRGLEERKVGLISLFKSRLIVSLIPKTRMLTVGFESPDPKLAAQVSTTLVNNYIDYNFRLKYDATRQASGWMEQQLDELKAKVEKSQQALVDYERQHAMANINSKDKQNVEEQMLSDLSKDVIVAQSDRIQKESLYNEVRSNRDRIAPLAHNELLQKLEEKAAELKGLYLEAVTQYGPKFPKAMRLREQVEENRAQIEQERNRVIERIHNDYTTAISREKLAADAVGREKERLGNLNELLVQHNILQREFEANQQLYQNLMQRLKDATVSAGLRSTNLHLVDAALPPSSPVRPRTMLNISIGFLAGLILGVVFAFVQEALDHSIRNTEELEAVLAIPSLGVIPLQRTAHSGYSLRHRYRAASPDPEVALVAYKAPTSAFAEAYRSLRTAILLSLPDQPPRTIVVTSALAGDGKTVNSLNLATVLAQRKGPVVVVDCDLRKSGITKVLKLDNKVGISAVLTGTSTLEEAIQQAEGLPDLWVLPSGPTPPSPADLLSSDKMVELLQKLSERFEHVVIDTPPVLAVTDATILSRIVDGVILVAECGVTSKAALQRTRRTLDTSGARILGVILNKFDYRQQGYYYGYYYYGRYYHKYGYGSGYGSHAYGTYPAGGSNSPGSSSESKPV